jgi:hypothetical protein
MRAIHLLSDPRFNGPTYDINEPHWKQRRRNQEEQARRRVFDEGLANWSRAYIDPNAPPPPPAPPAPPPDPLQLETDQSLNNVYEAMGRLPIAEFSFRNQPWTDFDEDIRSSLQTMQSVQRERPHEFRPLRFNEGTIERRMERHQAAVRQTRANQLQSRISFDRDQTLPSHERIAEHLSQIENLNDMGRGRFGGSYANLQNVATPGPNPVGVGQGYWGHNVENEETVDNYESERNRRQNDYGNGEISSYYGDEEDEY